MCSNETRTAMKQDQLFRVHKTLSKDEFISAAAPSEKLPKKLSKKCLLYLKCYPTGVTERRTTKIYRVSYLFFNVITCLTVSKLLRVNLTNARRLKNPKFPDEI